MQTKVLYNNLNPVWNVEAELRYYEVGDDITFSVCDYDAIGDHDEIGTAVLRSSQFYPHGFAGTISLNPKGSLKVEIDVVAPKVVKTKVTSLADAEGDDTSARLPAAPATTKILNHELLDDIEDEPDLAFATDLLVAPAATGAVDADFLDGIGHVLKAEDLDDLEDEGDITANLPAAPATTKVLKIDDLDKLDIHDYGSGGFGGTVPQQQGQGQEGQEDQSQEAKLAAQLQQQLLAAECSAAEAENQSSGDGSICARLCTLSMDQIRSENDALRAEVAGLRTEIARRSGKMGSGLIAAFG